MGVASGCGEQEAGVASGSGWNLCVWLLGVVVRRYMYIDFIILLIPTPSCICSFLQQYPYFLFIFLNIVHMKLYYKYSLHWVPLSILGSCLSHKL